MRILFLILNISFLFSCGQKNKTTKEKVLTEKKTATTTVIDSSLLIKKDDLKVVASNLDEKTNLIVETKTELKKVPTKKINNPIPVTATKSKEVISVPKPDNKTEKKLTSEVKKPIISVKPSTKSKIAIPKKEQITKKSTNTNWEILLKKHVDSKGNVNYKGFKNDETDLQSYLDYLAKNKPSNINSKNEKLAYYINLYNAATVKLILDNYPINSIKDIKSPWDKKIVKIGEELVSLGYIEHKILRKMNEPRIHFAINCASYSCPQLMNTIFTASKMEQQLEEATKIFINDTTRNQFGEKINLSKIFKWYKNDFTDDVSLLEYITKYSQKEINIKGKVSYLNYNWNLNEKQ